MRAAAASDCVIERMNQLSLERDNHRGTSFPHGDMSWCIPPQKSLSPSSCVPSAYRLPLQHPHCWQIRIPSRRYSPRRRNVTRPKFASAGPDHRGTDRRASSGPPKRFANPTFITIQTSHQVDAQSARAEADRQAEALAVPASAGSSAIDHWAFAIVHAPLRPDRRRRSNQISVRRDTRCIQPKL